MAHAVLETLTHVDMAHAVLETLTHVDTSDTC